MTVAEWTAVEVRVSVFSGDAATVSALVDGSGHFAVHPTLGRAGRWTLTHVPTGCAIAYGFATEEAARAGGARLGGLEVDWSRSDLSAWKGSAPGTRAAIVGLLADGGR